MTGGALCNYATRGHCHRVDGGGVGHYRGVNENDGPRRPLNYDEANKISDACVCEKQNRADLIALYLH